MVVNRGRPDLATSERQVMSASAQDCFARCHEIVRTSLPFRDDSRKASAARPPRRAVTMSQVIQRKAKSARCWEQPTR